MKKTLATIATGVIMISSLASFAAEKTNPLKDAASAKIISTYLESSTIGSVELNKYLFAEDFQYSNSANNDTFNKKEYTAFLKAHKGVNYDCKTSYEILDESGQACIAKATIVFENFTRVDYITLNQEQDGWKVSKVVTTYK